jgi:hypothetical protein
VWHFRKPNVPRSRTGNEDIVLPSLAEFMLKQLITESRQAKLLSN